MVVLFFIMISVCLAPMLIYYLNIKNTNIIWTPSPITSCPKNNIQLREKWKGEAGDYYFSIKIDIDGDSIPDKLKVRELYGNALAVTSVSLKLSSINEKFQVNLYSSFSDFVTSTPIPEILLNKRYRCALDFVETVLFTHISEHIDPSLEWLIKKQKQKQWGEEWVVVKTTNNLLPFKDEIKWYQGSPLFPTSYTVRVKANKGIHWFSYGGHNHKSHRKLRKFKILTQQNHRVLLGTPHGVILTDIKRSKYAWIYISTGGHKFRWVSIESARIENDTAIIYVRGLPVKDDEEPLVHINLKSGKVISN